MSRNKKTIYTFWLKNVPYQELCTGTMGHTGSLHAQIISYIISSGSFLSSFEYFIELEVENCKQQCCWNKDPSVVSINNVSSFLLRMFQSV